MTTIPCQPRVFVPYLCVLLAASALSADPVPRIQPPHLGLESGPQDAAWPGYDRDRSGQRYSPLDQIDNQNASALTQAWSFKYPRELERAEMTPIVSQGRMYLPVGGNGICALDAATGSPLWHAEFAPQPVDRVADSNRGLALENGRLFLITSDAHLAAVDARSGRLLWKSRLSGFYQVPEGTPAPLAVNGLIITGTRGYLEAFDAATGKRAWRFTTAPEPESQQSESWAENVSLESSGAWATQTGTFDADRNLLYWTYSTSILALDVSTGRLVWEFGFPGNDAALPDENQTPVLIDAMWKGLPRRLLAQANRNGLFYVLDRDNGELLLSRPFAMENSEERRATPSYALTGTRICPDVYGATNWQSAAYNPRNAMFFVVARDGCSRVFPQGPMVDIHEATPAQSVKAIDLESGEVRWAYNLTPLSQMSHAGTMTTAGNLLFFGVQNGYLMAADTCTGRILWERRTPSKIRSAPMSYAVNGRQYVAIATRDQVLTFALPQH